MLEATEIEVERARTEDRLELKGWGHDVSEASYRSRGHRVGKVLHDDFAVMPLCLLSTRAALSPKCSDSPYI